MQNRNVQAGQKQGEIPLLVGLVAIVLVAALIFLAYDAAQQQMRADRLEAKNSSLKLQLENVVVERDQLEGRLATDVRFRPLKICIVQELLKEYRKADAALVASKSNQEADQAEWRAYLIFDQLYAAYYDLSEAEKNAFVVFEGKNLAFRFHKNMGQKVSQVKLPCSGPSRSRFEDFLGNAYEDSDRFGAYGFTKNEVGQKINKEVNSYLAQRGLLVSP